MDIVVLYMEFTDNTENNATCYIQHAEDGGEIFGQGEKEKGKRKRKRGREETERESEI